MSFPSTAGLSGTTHPIAAILEKFAMTIVFLWLLNVLFIAVHELGHASLAACCDATVLSITISPIGFDGATTYTTPGNAVESNIVRAGGILATVVSVIVLYKLYFELSVYVMGLRTIESLINFNPGSDMAALTQWIGPWSYIVSLIIACLLLVLIGHTVYENRLKIPAHGPSET